MDYVTKILKVASNAAYNLELGFVPDYVEVQNATSGGDASELVSAYWYKDMGDGYYNGLINQSTVTDGLIPVIGTSGGFTAYDTTNFAARQVLIDTGSSKVTKATQAVVSSSAHGLTTGDKINFQGIYEGMTELNGLSTTITKIGAGSFSCDDIDSTGFTTWNTTLATGQFIKTDELVQDTGKQGITLGTNIMITADDYLVVRAWYEGNYDQITQA